MVAGSEDEQIGALPRVLERYPAGQVLWSGPSGGTRSARLLREHLAQAKIPLVEAASGQTLDLGDGARLEVVSANRRGAVLLLKWKNFRALLPLSLDRAAVETLVEENDLADVTALLLSDGGYAPVNPPEWIERLHPQLALLRTDQNGWIELSTDGEQMWVEVERK